MRKNSPVILLIIPNLGQGGAQNVYRQHYEYLSKHYTVQGCVFNWDGAHREQWPSTIHSLEVSGGANAVGKIRFFLTRISRLRKLKKQLNVTVSISHLEGADYVNVLSGIGEKKILWVHGTKKFDEAIRGWIGYARKSVLMPWLYKQADRVVTVSKAIAAELRSSYPALKSKLLTVYNGIDGPRIQELKKQEVSAEYESLCENHFVIVTHCRLALQKNVSGLLQVAVVCRKKNLNVKWVIVGDGELRSSLLQECEQHSLAYYSVWHNHAWDEQRQIYFLGYQSNPYPFLTRAKLYVMSSGWEGFPLALCEALACALPVMSTDCYTGPREILAPGEYVLPKATQPEYASYGVLMPVIDKRSAEVWAEELRNLISDKKRLAEYASFAEQRAQQLSLQAALEQVNTVINSVVNHA